MSIIFWSIIGILVILGLALIALYNKIVTSHLKVKNAWSQVDVQLKRRFDLIPNLVETVKGYMAHEEGTLTKIMEARNKYVSASNISDKSAATNELNNVLKSVFALSEAYPDLKANTNFMSLQNELSETESKIAYSRQFYNDTVQMYNTTILTFPANMFASLFGFKEEKFFEIAEAQRENVKVDFSK